MRIVSQTIGDLYKTSLLHLLTWGRESSPRGMKTKEILGAQLVLNDLRNNILVSPVRDLNFRFMVAEWLWIEAGREDVRFMAQYNKNIAQFSDDGDIFNGAYGPRLARQWDYVISALRHLDSRQAVATIWTPSPVQSKDIPCTVAFQFLVRDGVLHLIATMRSSDAWLGLPYDIFNFSQIANGIAGAVGAEPGSLTMQLGSFHLYEPNWEAAKMLIDSPVSTVKSPKLPNRPPAWDMTCWCMGTIVPWTEWIMKPWGVYVHALQTKTKAEALEVLREAANS